VSVNGGQTRIGRREQAERTRRRILDAAYELFCANGYEATTMQQVADTARVAVQTVYLRFGTKDQLLSELEDVVILGGDPASRLFEQPWVHSLREENDPHRLLARFVEVELDIKKRTGPFVAAVGRALPSDPRTNAAREAGRDQFFGLLVDRLDALGALRHGLSRSRALDIMRAVDTFEGYVELTLRRGWSTAEYAEWFHDLLAEQLLGS
jgi:AcrR family transcriptional regulator